MSVLIVLLGILFVIPLVPTICFIIGYFIGLVSKILIGTFLIQALNTIGIHIIKLNDIPIVAGGIAAVCSFITMFLAGTRTSFNKEK